MGLAIRTSIQPQPLEGAGQFWLRSTILTTRAAVLMLAAIALALTIASGLAGAGESPPMPWQSIGCGSFDDLIEQMVLIDDGEIAGNTATRLACPTAFELPVVSADVAQPAIPDQGRSPRFVTIAPWISDYPDRCPFATITSGGLGQLFPNTSACGRG